MRTEAGSHEEWLQQNGVYAQLYGTLSRQHSEAIESNT